MLSKNIYRICTAGIAIAALFLCSDIKAAVFVDYFIPTTPQPEPFSMGPGESLKTILATDSSEITITGGAITNLQESFSRSAVRLTDDAKTYISGGHMRVHTRSGVTFGTPVLHVEDNSEMAISGGLFESFGNSDYVIDVGDSVNVFISGGRFVGHNSDVVRLPFIASNAVLTIRGGQFLALRSNDVDLSIGDGTVNILAREAKLGGSPIGFGEVTAGTGILSVVYQNGDLEDISFQKSSSGIINLISVPEPCSLTLLVVTAAFVGSICRRRKA